MSKYSHYLIHTADWSICPQCKKKVEMLARARRLQTAPSFWICWDCRRVWQIGRGPVQNLDQARAARIPWDEPHEPKPTS